MPNEIGKGLPVSFHKIFLKTLGLQVSRINLWVRPPYTLPSPFYLLKDKEGNPLWTMYFVPVTYKKIEQKADLDNVDLNDDSVEL